MTHSPHPSALAARVSVRRWTVQQPAHGWRVTSAVDPLCERHCRAEARQPGIERYQIGELYPHPAQANGEPWHFSFGQRRRPTRLLESRGEAIGPDLIEDGHRRHVE